MILYTRVFVPQPSHKIGIRTGKPSGQKRFTFPEITLANLTDSLWDYLRKSQTNINYIYNVLFLDE